MIKHTLFAKTISIPLLIFGLAVWGQAPNVIDQTLSKAVTSLREATVAAKTDTYATLRNSIPATYKSELAEIGASQFPTSTSPVQARLAKIWLARLDHPDRFKAITPYGQATSLDPTQALALAGRQAPDPRRRVNIARFSLGTLHPDIIAATKAHPEIYQAVLELGEDIRQKAAALLREGGRNTLNLGQEYENRLKAIYGLAGDSPEMLMTIRDIVSAAQPPIFGATYPPPPALNPDYLLAWEELAMQTDDLELKRKLVRLVCGIDPNATIPCLGLILEQVLAGWKRGNHALALQDLYTVVLDHFRKHPSLTAAIVLSEAIAFGQSEPNPVVLPLGKRLDSPQWQAVLRSLAHEPGGRTHRDRLQLARQKPK